MLDAATLPARACRIPLASAEAFVDTLFARVLDGSASFAEILAALTVADSIARRDAARASRPRIIARSAARGALHVVADASATGHVAVCGATLPANPFIAPAGAVPSCKRCARVAP